MARIAGVDIPREKQLHVALTYIHGIGPSVSRRIVAAAGVDPTTRVKELSDDEINRLRQEIESKIKTEGDVRRDVQNDIKRLIEIGCYRGVRHRSGLPVRGQRTHTNGRTRKGRRRSIGGIKGSGIKGK